MDGSFNYDLLDVPGLYIDNFEYQSGYADFYLLHDDFQLLVTESSSNAT